jgi:hypothetical protein
LVKYFNQFSQSPFLLSIVKRLAKLTMTRRFNFFQFKGKTFSDETVKKVQILSFKPKLQPQGASEQNHN